MTMHRIAGQVFGRWKVRRLAQERTACGGMKWWCQCECGNVRIVSADNLVRGNARSAI